MSAEATEERRLVAYLLGRLSDEEQVELEERYMEEDELHEELQATADDLIHAYLAGGLASEDRERFETYFLASPRRRQRLAFVRGLLAALDRIPTQTTRRAWTAWFIPLAATLAVVLAGLLIVQLLRRPRVEPRTAAGLITPPSTALSTEPPPPSTSVPAHRPRRPTPPPVRVVRLPREAAPVVEVALAGRARSVRLEVPLDEARHPSYDAVIRRADGAEVWQARDLEPPEPGEPLVLEVPAAALAGGEYTLTVESEVVRSRTTPSPLLRQYTLRVRRER